jgi:predicted transcriptional regulator
MTSRAVYNILKELRCATALEIAERLRMSRKVAHVYLNRMAARGVVEKRVVGKRAVMYCVREGDEGRGASHMPGGSPAPAESYVRRSGLYTEMRMRMERVLEVLQREGCISVGALMRKLNVTHTKAYYAMRVLLLLRQGVKVRIGRTAVLCRDRVVAEETISRLREAVHRLAVGSGMKYVTASKVLRAALRDGEVYALLGRFVPLKRNSETFPPAVLKFVDAVLESLYGEPLKAGNRHVYVVTQPRAGHGFEIIDSVETHAVRINLPDDVATALQGVSDVDEIVLQALEQLLTQYRP